MKLPILTATVLLLLGTTGSIYARQEKGHAEHSQAARPAQQAKSAPRAKAAPQQRAQAKPAQRQQAQNVKPAQQAKTAPRQRTQQAASPKQQRANPATRTAQSNAGRTQARAPQSRPVAGNRGASAHGRISNAHYAASFGRGHSFHVNQGDYAHRRFQYGGYSFGFVDPWPIGWGYSDAVYVVYIDGGYYMYDSVHPGLRIAVNIL